MAMARYVLMSKDARVLLKAGVGAFNQEPYSEVMATELHSRLMQPGEYLPYRLFEDGRRIQKVVAQVAERCRVLICVAR